MARLTIEDCLTQVNNRYDLVPLAAKRARQLTLGKDALVEKYNDKFTVVALREIAAGFVTLKNINTIGKTELLDEFAILSEGEEAAKTE